MEKNKTTKYFKYAIGEIALVVIGIIIALQLNTWKENSKISQIEKSILIEITNGLHKDLLDINHNVKGHFDGIEACNYWNKLIYNQPVDADSIASKYTRLLRCFISIQNTSSYESLKSRGLELISNDSLRLEIISLYEEDYQAIKKIEEDYQEAQYYNNFFNKINTLIHSNLIFNTEGDLASIQVPLNFDSKMKNEMQSYLWKIKINRQFAVRMYDNITLKIESLIQKINLEIRQNKSN
jgi:hypothetical protein